MCQWINEEIIEWMNCTMFKHEQTKIIVQKTEKKIDVNK